MEKRVSKALNENSTELSDSIPSAWAEKLESLLKHIARFLNSGERSGLANDILSYVLYGNPSSVLKEAGQLIGVSRCLYSHNLGAGKQPQAMYDGFDSVPPAVALRWARLLEACVPVHNRHYNLRFPGGVNWPEALLIHCSGSSVNARRDLRPIAKNISMATLEHLLVEAGMDASALISSVFLSSEYGGGGGGRLLMVSDLNGFAEALDRHVEVLRPLLQPSLLPHRLHIIGMLEKAEQPTLDKLAPELCALVVGSSPLSRPEFLLDRLRIIALLEKAEPHTLDKQAAELCELLVSSSKQVRAAAEKVVRRCGTATELPLRDIARNGKPDQRLHALRLLYSLAQVTKNAALQVFCLETALADRASSVKALAEEWNSLNTPTATEQDTLKSAMSGEYVDRAALAAEAVKSLSKGVLKNLQWFPWNALPKVRWADTKEYVPVEILRWMMVQAVKLKSGEPNAVLRNCCALFEPSDREEFGQMIFNTWLSEDTRRIAPVEALEKAREKAQSRHNFMGHSPQYFQNDPNFGQSLEEITATYLPEFLRQPAGSASDSRGLLAVVAACAGEGVVAPTARYLKEWYGVRAVQGKVLIAMLAWIDHPSATQLMLSIGDRFRTRGFQEEAIRQAEALAVRKGWTLTELADRTIPSAGFNEMGILELNYGSRNFTARLRSDHKVELYTAEGKKIASLPEPRQEDDAELAREAKKTLSAAKKEIKNSVILQTDRLYEALCTQRDWPFADWQRYLNQHVLMRHLVQRLVWAQINDGKVVATFRPLDDGTLTDYEDNEVHLRAGDQVRIAHDVVLTTEQIRAWQQHFVDYEIVPLFQQIGKGVYTLPPENENATKINDFEGHVMEAFALRRRALEMGYTRGGAQDAGWFYSYYKLFSTLGIQVVIEFTGNSLPETNRTIALLTLAFSKTADTGSYQRSILPLSTVPPILLSECYNDLRLIASAGNGFDADWRKKSEYSI